MEKIELTPSNARDVIAKHLREDQQYKNDCLQKIVDALVQNFDGGHIQMAEKILENLFTGQLHDPNSVAVGYYWVRFKGSERMEVAYFNGNFYELTGSSFDYRVANFDRFIRIEPPKIPMEGMKGEFKLPLY